jgi:hypothetical protein
VNAPGSKSLRRLWFDKVHDKKAREAQRARREAAIQSLAVQDIGRVKRLEEKHEQILQLAEDNKSFTIELLGPELSKLDQLVDGYIELALNCARYERYLAQVSWDELEHNLRRWQEAADHEEDPQLRRTAKKNLDVLLRRRDKLMELSKYTQGARGQLALIENTFQLLGDQILTMQSPKELGGQLDDLMDGVEAVRSVAEEREMLMQEA